jgi:hypothetical protein
MSFDPFISFLLWECLSHISCKLLHILKWRVGYWLWWGVWEFVTDNECVYYASFHFEPCLNIGISSTVCVHLVEATGRTSPSTSLPPGHRCKSLATLKSISVGWRTLPGGSAAASTMLASAMISPGCKLMLQA